MAGMKRMLPWAAAVSIVALLAGCDNGPSAVANKQAAGAQMASAETTPRSADGEDAKRVRG